MKFLKILLFLLIGIVVMCLLFLLVGLVNPSVSYGHEVSVDKPIEEAWALTMDVSKYDQWLEGFKSLELIEGERNVVGSKYKVIVDPGNGQPDFEMIETLTSMKEMEHVELDFASEMMDFKQIMSFSEKDGKTTVKTDSKVIGSNIVMRSMFSIMEMLTGSFTKQETKNMEALKVLIDENKTDYFPEPIEADTLMSQ